MKVIFLDVDGVLNSVRSMIALHAEDMARYLSGRDDPLLNSHIDPIAVKLLNIATEGDVKLVISSAHRFHVPEGDLPALQLYFQRFGLTGHVIGATPRSRNGHRGTEIKVWLDQHPEVEAYAIVDDSCDMLDEQLPYFVEVDLNDGLSYNNCVELGRILGLTAYEARAA